MVAAGWPVSPGMLLPDVAVVQLIPSIDVFTVKVVFVGVVAFQAAFEVPRRGSTRARLKAGSGYCVALNVPNVTVPEAVLANRVKPPLAISAVSTADVGMVRELVAERTADVGMVRANPRLFKAADVGMVRASPKLLSTALVGMVRLPEFVSTADVGMVRLFVIPITPDVGIVRDRPRLFNTPLVGMVRANPKLCSAALVGIVRDRPRLCKTAEVGIVRDTVVADGVNVLVVICISDATPAVALFEM